MHRTHALRFRHNDTRLLLGGVLLYAALAVAAGLLLPTEAAVLTVLGAALVLGGGLALHLFRTRQADAVQQANHVQALQALHRLLPLRAPLPPFTGWAASAELASTLYTLVCTHRPEVVVELGSGASTLVIAYALEQNGTGRLVSLDHDAAYGAATARHLRRHGLERWAEVRPAALQPLRLDGRTVQWYDPAPLEDVDSIDLLVVDGPPYETNALARYPALPLLADRLSDRALVVADDADRDDEQAMVRRWQAAYGPFEVERFSSPKGTAVLYKDGAAP